MYGTLSKSTAEQLAQAAQLQNTAGNEESSQNVVANDLPVTTMSPIPRSTENHSTLAGNEISVKFRMGLYGLPAIRRFLLYQLQFTFYRESPMPERQPKPLHSSASC